LINPINGGGIGIKEGHPRFKHKVKPINKEGPLLINQQTILSSSKPNKNPMITYLHILKRPFNELPLIASAMNDSRQR